jgi:proteasome lid subunit RPN8/RPN11
MIRYAGQSLPNEACGLLAGEIRGERKMVRQAYCLTNADESPVHFSLLPAEQVIAVKDMRKNGWMLIGSFHSHPTAPAYPSPEDIRLAFDPDLSYVIVSLLESAPVIKSFRIREGAVSEEVVSL